MEFLFKRKVLCFLQAVISKISQDATDTKKKQVNLSILETLPDYGSLNDNPD